ERIPGELAGLLGGELVVQRFGIVIVDEHERITDAEPVIGLEDQFVATGGNLGAHIEFDVFGHGGSSFIRRGQIPSHYFHGITPCLLCHSPSTTCRRSRRPPASATDAVGPLRIRQSHGIAIAFALYGVDVISIDAAAGMALITYPLMVLIFGALYGCTVSPGQALCGVVSLQTAHGRRVGFWRGMGRYLAIGFFPIALLLLVWVFLDAPAVDSAP